MWGHGGVGHHGRPASFKHAPHIIREYISSSESQVYCAYQGRHSIARHCLQATAVDPDISLCHFHIHHAAALARIASQSQAPAPCLEFSAAMQSLTAAAGSLARAAKASTSSPAAITAATGAVAACRAELGAAMQRRQHDTLQPAYPGLLNFEDEAAACRPFSTRLPVPPSVMLGQRAVGADRALHDLNPLPALTFDESQNINYLLPWLSSLPEEGDEQALVLMLHLAERWFFSQACSALGGKHRLAACDVGRGIDLLGVYSRKLQLFEGLVPRTADVSTEILSVELRSRETLITWINLCFAHQQAAHEWPELHKFALPVQADDLRHLVLSDRLAATALHAVAAYVSSVNCSSTDGPVFSTRTDATFKLASAFAQSNEALTKKLNEEIRVSVARIEEHWDAVVSQQKLVSELQEKLSQAHDRLANAKLDKDQASETLDQKIIEAEARADALQSKTAHHKSRVVSVIMDLYNSSRTRSAADAEQDKKVKAATAAWRKSRAYAQQLRSERKHGCPGGGSLAGTALQNAQQDIAAAKQQIKELRVALEEANVAPDRVWQALPDSRLPGPKRDAALAILFFLHPEHCGSLPHLQQLCCAAQQGVIPWPLRSPGGMWDASAVLAREPAHSSWREFYQSTSATAISQQRLIVFDQEEDPEQLSLYTTFHAPPAAEVGPADVMAYRSKSDGVWFPKADGLRLVWRGGPVARYSCEKSAIDPFANLSGQPAAAAQAFTEPGQFSPWLLTHASGPSRMCMRFPASAPARQWEQCGCSGPAASRASKVIADRPSSFDLTRGNRSLTEQGDRHPSLTADQWLAVAGLRSYPHTQLRRLCVGLRDGTLLLEHPLVRSIAACKMSATVSSQPVCQCSGCVQQFRVGGCPVQVCTAVRMALYQTGQLERTKAGATADCIACAWHDCHSDLAVLCSELRQWHQRMLCAPKFLLQVSIHVRCSVSRATRSAAALTQFILCVLNKSEQHRAATSCTWRMPIARPSVNAMTDIWLSILILVPMHMTSCNEG